jgi:hypothetical protein
VNALVDAVGTLPRHAQKFDAITELARRRDVFGRHTRDALNRDLVEAGSDAESQRCKQREFVRRVVTTDVEAGIGFGKAESLRLGEHFWKCAAGRLHLGQDEIAGAVQDSAHRAHAMRDETLAQCLDDRNAAGGGGFEFERYAFAFGEFGEIGAMAREQ